MGRSINPAPGSRKTVLRGTILIGAAATSQTATIPSIDTSKGDLRFLGSRSTGGSGQSSSDVPTIEVTNSTTITATRQNITSGNAIAVSWELTVSY